MTLIRILLIAGAASCAAAVAISPWLLGIAIVEFAMAWGEWGIATGGISPGGRR